MQSQLGQHLSYGLYRNSPSWSADIASLPRTSSLASPPPRSLNRQSRSPREELPSFHSPRHRNNNDSRLSTSTSIEQWPFCRGRRSAARCDGPPTTTRTTTATHRQPRGCGFRRMDRAAAGAPLTAWTPQPQNIMQVPAELDPPFLP